MKMQNTNSQTDKEKIDGARRSEKKLRKQEERLQERLKKARTEQEQIQARLERTEARLQKRVARVQRLEERLARIQQQRGLKAMSEPAEAARKEQSVSVPLAEQTPEDGALIIIPPLSTQTTIDILATEEAVLIPLEEPTNPAFSVESPVQSSGEAIAHALQARATAEAAEEEARAAAERVHQASQRLEEGLASGRHLEQEMVLLKAEEERASMQAEEARQTANDVEHETDALAQEQAVETSWQEKVWSVQEIAEAEEQLEVDVTRSRAEAAARAAAEAEMLAEASSVRVRKARIIARQADQELTLIRAAIRNGSLTGEAAEAALQAAENKSTYAHAELADAEDAEESAIDAARNAEADAEVAEGMSVSSADRYIDDIEGQEVQAIAEQDERQRALATDEDEETQERPAIHPERRA